MEWLCSDSKITVLDYHPETSAYCLLTYIVTSFVALFIILFSCFIVYTCRWRIRLKIYKWRRKRGKYNRLSNYDQCLYDCYVVYSFGDINWIKTFLIPNMEDVYNRRLCINDRDFPIGVGLSNHMINSIESSRAVRGETIHDPYSITRHKFQIYYRISLRSCLQYQQLSKVDRREAFRRALLGWHFRCNSYLREIERLKRPVFRTVSGHS